MFSEKVLFWKTLQFQQGDLIKETWGRTYLEKKCCSPREVVQWREFAHLQYVPWFAAERRIRDIHHGQKDSSGEKSKEQELCQRSSLASNKQLQLEVGSYVKDKQQKNGLAKMCLWKNSGQVVSIQQEQLGAHMPERQRVQSSTLGGRLQQSWDIAITWISEWERRAG